MQQIDPKTVDDTVSTLELVHAGDAPKVDFPVVDLHDQIGDDELTAKSLFTRPPRTPAAGLLNLKTMRTHHIPIGGVGLCLYDVRNFCWGVDAVWPTAEDAGAHGAPIHRFKHFVDVPRGMTIIFVNDHVGHITVGLGGGLNNTSDYHEPGYNGVATIANTYDWCNATDWFGIEVVNNVDVWPSAKPKPKPKPWSLPEREREVHRLLKMARDNDAPQRRIDGLKTWDGRLVKRLDAQHLDRLPL